MQPTIVKTSKSELCLVAVPDDAHDFRFTETKEMFTYEHNFNVNYFSSTIEHIDLPFPCELIGPLKDITEEQAKELVDDGPGYPDNYKAGEELFYTATKCMKELAKQHGCYMRNPYGKDPGRFYHGEQNEGTEVLEQWQGAQSRTGKWIILKRTA